MSLRRKANIAAVCFGVVAFNNVPAGWAQMSHGGHAGMHPAPSASAAPGEAAGTASSGKLIRESTIDGRSLTYRLYSWDERNAMMKGMEGHTMPGMDTTGKATNHLMVFIKGADGKELSGGKVGFIVTGPDKAEQKTLTMAMTGGYGADVALKAKGAYTIKTKAVFADRTLTEEFAFTIP